jgi:ADP-heptose:LPS heptosyltransferase
MFWMEKLGKPVPQRIVILRALQLGDLLCSVPAIRALRAALPEAHISLIGLPWAGAFVERFHHYIDSFLEFPGFPGFPEREAQISAFPHFLSQIQAQRTDLALQMQGSGNLSNSLTVLFGARNNAGFYLPGQFCPDPERFLVYPAHAPEVWRHLRLIEFLGMPLQGDELEFPLVDEDNHAFQPLRECYQLERGSYICVHPGARAANRRWPAEKFAAVADHLAGNGYRIVLTGARAEADLTRAVASWMKLPAIDLAGKTSLGALGVLLTGARLLVCNDTGVSHMAAALKIPSIVLFTASDPNRWAPLNNHLHCAIPWAAGAAPEDVSAEAENLLALDVSYAGS